jgi:hypothetical protein
MTDDINCLVGYYKTKDMEDLNLQANHTYLLRYGSSDTLHSITVLLITDKAYKIRWNGSGSETWELKRRINCDYSLTEDISDFVVNEQIKDFKENYFNVNTKLVPCPACGGTGETQDFTGTSTTGKNICTRCWGSKMIAEIVEITQH